MATATTKAVLAENHDFAMSTVIVRLDFETAAESVTTTHSYYGFVVQAFIDHDDTTQPTNLWDLVITDEFGVDTLNGKGANIAVATDTYTFTQSDLDNGMACSGQLTFAGTNGGTGNGIVVITLYIARYQ